MINLLPPWISTNPQPAFLDSESGSALEQTAKMYAKVNELIESYNSFITSIDKKMADFLSADAKSKEEHMTAIRQEYQDFIDIINLKVMELEVYLKTNLEGTVTDVLHNLENSGFITDELKLLYEKILNSLSVLDSRMTAFTTLAEGSTTGDAELTDARIDYTGKPWTNLGLHLREIEKELFTSILTENQECINSNNQIDSYAGAGYFLFFDEPVYLVSIKPYFTVASGTANYKIGHSNNLADGGTVTYGDAETFNIGEEITLNKLMKPGDCIRFGSSDGLLKFCSDRTKEELFSARVGYADSSGNISSVESNKNYCIAGEYSIKKIISLVNEKTLSELQIKDHWKDKKIVWFGTSIPAGSYDSNPEHKYPQMVGSILGATIYNESVGSSSISRTLPESSLPSYLKENNPFGFDTTDFEFAARCLGDSLEKKEWLIANYNSGLFTTNVPSEMTTDLANLIRSYSYENKLDKYLAGGEVGNVDLYVFDHGFNEEYSSRNHVELENTYGPDNLYSFHGGMNFLIRRIFSKNRNAKIIIIGHYTDNASTRVHSSEHVAAVCSAQKEVADRWNLHYVDLASMLGWSGELVEVNGAWNENGIWVESIPPIMQTISIKDLHVPDTVHPYTDASGESNTRIAEVISSQLRNIIR